MTADMLLARANHPHFRETVRSTQGASLALWTLESDSGPERLLYGWIIPSREQAGPWSRTEPKPRAFDGLGCRICRNVVTAPANNLFELLCQLASGAKLGEAAAAASVASPGKIDGLSFDSRRTEIPPVTFLPAEPTQLGLLPWARFRTSPNREAGCYALRVAFLDEGEAALAASTDNPPELIEWSLETLEDATGLPFRGPQAAAVGSVEWLVFPAADTAEEPLLRVTTGAAPDGVAARVGLGHAAGGPYMIRVRASAGHEILSETLRELPSAPDRFELTLPPETGELLATAWRWEREEGMWFLWDEKRIFLIKNIALNLGLIGLQGEFDAPWLRRLEGTRAAVRASKLRRLQQVSFETHSLIGEQFPWVEAARGFRRIAGRVAPENSGARFFAKGWAEVPAKGRAEVPGQLELVEWLTGELERQGAASVILADPYFDEFGLEQLARTKNGSLRLTVITNTQARADEREPASRAKRILAMCNQLSPILSGLHLEIVDLRSKGGGTRRLFHDRYLLFFDASERVSRGYNLSNSLQGATKRAPLLVTPVPDDVLDSVADYVQRLVKAEGPDWAEVTAERIYPLPTQPPAATETFASVRPFLDLLANDARELASSEFEKELRRRGGIIGKGLKFPADEAAKLAAESLPKQLRSLPDEDATRLWCAFAEWCARTPEPEAIVDAAARDSWLGEFAGRFLADAPERRPPAGVFGVRTRDTSGYVNRFAQGIESSVDWAASVLEYSHGLLTFGHYPISRAALLLASYFPDRIGEVVDAVVGPPAKEYADPVLFAIVQALFETSHGNRTPLWVSALLTAGSAPLRAVAGRCAMQSASSPEQVRHALDKIAPLPPHERVLTLARLAYDLRVRANRAGGHEEAEPLATRRAVFEKLVELWPTNADAVFLRRVVQLISGPIEGSWAESSSEDLLSPLAASGAVKADQIFQVWSDILEARMGDRPQTSHFYADTDVTLARAWAYWLWASSAAVRAKALDLLDSRMAACERVLRAPFERSRRYDRWAGSAEQLVWLKSLLGEALIAIEGGTAERRTVELYDRATNMVTQLPSRERRFRAAAGLLDWADDVDKRVAHSGAAR